jgi:ectoine hydroxylase-related dioxygenase (phytanoyl-CoA dioxygenase family)
MRTLWIALTPCGEDAPSLQWVAADMPLLLSPHELSPAAVMARFGATALQHAVLRAGDALLFDGLRLHRTHLTPAMTQPRRSLELRFFRAEALPARVASDAGLRLP